MNAGKKRRLTSWLNVFLLVINISALTTILFFNGNSTAVSSKDKFSSDEFLRDYLSLSDEQFRDISEMDAKIFRVYQSLIDMQCEENFKILYELSQDDPSKAKMDSIAQNIGRLQTGLRKQTIKHFMNVKSIVDEDQEEKLDQILIEMMDMNKQCKFCNKEDCDRRNRLYQKQK